MGAIFVYLCKTWAQFVTKRIRTPDAPFLFRFFLRDVKRLTLGVTNDWNCLETIQGDWIVGSQFSDSLQFLLDGL
jgi:hypothetical protein